MTERFLSVTVLRPTYRKSMWSILANHHLYSTCSLLDFQFLSYISSWLYLPFSLEFEKVLYKIVNILPKIYQSKCSHTFSVSKKHFALVQCILVQCDVFTEWSYRVSKSPKFIRIGVPRNVAKFTRKQLCQSVLFNKVAGLQLC